MKCECRHCKDTYWRTGQMEKDCCPDCQLELTTGEIRDYPPTISNRGYDQLEPRQKEKNHWG